MKYLAIILRVIGALIISAFMFAILAIIFAFAHSGPQVVEFSETYFIVSLCIMVVGSLVGGQIVVWSAKEQTGEDSWNNFTT